MFLGVLEDILSQGRFLTSAMGFGQYSVLPNFQVGDMAFLIKDKKEI